MWRFTLTHTVTLRPFGIEFECQDQETVLSAALRAGIALRYGCKHGNCGSCKAQIAEGDVDLEGASEAALLSYERAAGVALLCSAYPLGDIAIDLPDDYDEAELRSAPPIQEFDTTVTEIRPLTHDIVMLRLSLQNSAVIDFKSGQYVEINVPGTHQWRAFSMANPSHDSTQIVLMIKLLPGGAASGYLGDRARPGDRVAVRGPYGQFRLAEGTAPIVMVAGGSGMAPIASMLGDLSRRASDRPIALYYGARTKRDLFWESELRSLQQTLPNFRFVLALSDPAPMDDWQGAMGRITDVLDRDCGNLRGTEGYLCGPPPMIDSAIAVLKAKGMFSTRIRFDKFVGTGSRSESN